MVGLGRGKCGPFEDVHTCTISVQGLQALGLHIGQLHTALNKSHLLLDSFNFPNFDFNALLPLKIAIHRILAQKALRMPNF